MRGRNQYTRPRAALIWGRPLHRGALTVVLGLEHSVTLW